MSELKVKKQDVLNCYNNVDGGAKEVLEQLFGKETFEFDYKTITSFEKACERKKICAFVPNINTVAQNVSTRTDINHNALRSAVALYQLLTIQDAINDGWKQGKDGVAWYPYWIFYSQKELDDMGEKRQKELGIKLLSAVRADSAENAGVRGAFANDRGALTGAYYGFPLCLKDSEMAIWMGNQFEDLFFDYFGITVKGKEA